LDLKGVELIKPTKVKNMMYGFGDVESPLPESVELLEALVFEYIMEMTKLSIEVAKSNRLKKEDLLFIIRKDPKKYNRAKELLVASVVLKEAKRLFDE
jgi:transcription initiation factor TFIID subunit 13